MSKKPSQIPHDKHPPSQVIRAAVLLITWLTENEGEEDDQRKPKGNEHDPGSKPVDGGQE